MMVRNQSTKVARIFLASALALLLSFSMAYGSNNTTDINDNHRDSLCDNETDERLTFNENITRGNWSVYNIHDVFRRNVSLSSDDRPVYEMSKYYVNKNTTNTTKYTYYMYHLGKNWHLGINYTSNKSQVFTRDDAGFPSEVNNTWTITPVANVSDAIPMPTLRATIECDTKASSASNLWWVSIVVCGAILCIAVLLGTGFLVRRRCFRKHRMVPEDLPTLEQLEAAKKLTTKHSKDNPPADQSRYCKEPKKSRRAKVNSAYGEIQETDYLPMSTSANNNSVGAKKASKLLDSEETLYANQVELLAVKEKGEQRCPVVPEEDEAVYANVTEVAKKEGQGQSKGQMRGQRTSQGERRKKKSSCSNPTDSTGDPRKVMKKKSPSIPKEADPGTNARKSNLSGKVKVKEVDTKPPMEDEELYLNTDATPADDEELYTNEMEPNVGRDVKREQVAEAALTPADDEELYTNEMEANVGRDVKREQVEEAALTPEATDDDIYYNSESFPAAQTPQTEESPAGDPGADEETYENTDDMRMNVSALKKLWSTKQ